MSDRTDPAPARVLGTFSAACIVIGAIIGVGIFRQPSQAAAAAGTAPLTLIAWGAAGLIALCGALVFAELGTRYHSNGAQYEILRDAFGPLPGFLFVFCNATLIQGGAIGVIAVICAENLGIAAGRPLHEPIVLAPALLLILGVSAANMLGAKFGSGIQNVTVVGKVATLAVVIAIAAFAPPSAVAAPAPPGPAPRGAIGVFAALVPALFAYGGWQHALWVSGEVREPRRTLPRAIVGGVLVVVVVYVLGNWAYLRMLGHAGLVASQSAAADSVAKVFPAWGGRVIAAAVAVSAFGVLNAQLLSGPRLVYGMARDGRFYEIFGRVSKGSATPVAAILLLTGMAVVLIVLSRVVPGSIMDNLTTGVVFADTVFFAMTGAALMFFRVRDRKAVAEPGFRVPLYPFVPLLFILGEIGVLIGAIVPAQNRVAALFGLGWILLAGALYVVRFRRARS